MAQITKSSDLLLSVESHIRAALNLNPNDRAVRILVDPDSGTAYAADEYIWLYFPNASPDQNRGAGRRALKVNRQLVVGIRTRCGMDPAGDDRISYLQHIDKEDAVINATIDGGGAVGITLNWINGPSGTKRIKDQHQSIIESDIVFEAIYCPLLTPTEN